MRFFLFLLLLVFFDSSAFAVSGRDGRRVVNQTGGGATMSSTIYRAGAVGVAKIPSQISQTPSYQQPQQQSQPQQVVQESQTVVSVPEEDSATIELKKQRDICKNNNIGIGNTFVWASRHSNLNNYATMVEDVDELSNNACFVKVAMSSKDDSVDLSDIAPKYFEMGRSITCGSWVDEEMLKQRILDAKKSARVWGTVGATVGGVALGVGAMELFGNKLIGGKVEGQKALDGQELLRSQILALQKSNKSEYDRIIRALNDLESVCNDNQLWSGSAKPQDCDAANNHFIGLRDKLKSSNSGAKK
ncbi:MAG: hypothetical protein UIH99_01525 [Alphaproteobacteria bacterium]|nr:hypothetical protein [Alphaproteobacteria bacterium]